jgi:aspartate/methionine/tyrosine aminotransferase
VGIHRPPQHGGIRRAEHVGARTPELGRCRRQEAFDQLWLGYTQTFGAPDLRAVIASTYDRQRPEDILCFTGAEEGVFTAMQVLLDRDSHAIVVTPNYQSAETVPLSICAVTGVPLDPDQNWSLEINRIAAAIRPNTKLISINFPHNPTGKVLERDRFEALVALCRRHGIWLFSDEVYRLLDADTGIEHLPQAADIYERGLSLNVMSKAYGLPGLRIGWIACPDHEILVRMERMKHYLSICNSAPSERLACVALRARDNILHRNRRLLASNLKMLEQFFVRHTELFDWYRPEAACIVYPRYKGSEGVDRWARGLVKRAGVLLLPSTVYKSELTQTPSDRFRIGYGRANLEEGLAALEADLQRRDTHPGE